MPVANFTLAFAIRLTRCLRLALTLSNALGLSLSLRLALALRLTLSGSLALTLTLLLLTALILGLILALRLSGARNIASGAASLLSLLEHNVAGGGREREKRLTRARRPEYDAESRAADAGGADRPRLAVELARVAIVKAKYLGSAPLCVGFCPGAEYGPAKRWPAAHFARLAALIVNALPGVQIACLGGPKDREIADEIARTAGVQVRNLCGETSLLDAIALMKSMTAVVTNDSGLMHMAAALDVPLVALYGSTDPAHTPPLSPLAAIARIPIECSPCFQRVCPLGHLRCLNDLTPDLIWAQLQPRLAKRGLIPS